SPNEGGKKAYGLLRAALVDTGKIGVAKMMIRSKERMAVIRVYQQTIVVETIHYPDEVRNVMDVPNIPKQNDVNEKELDTAKLLIDQLTTTFEPVKYQDDYRTALRDLIEEKHTVDETDNDIEKTTPDNVTNLMDALQLSRNRAQKDKPKRNQTTKRRKAVQ